MSKAVRMNKDIVKRALELLSELEDVLSGQVHRFSSDVHSIKTGLNLYLADIDGIPLLDYHRDLPKLMREIKARIDGLPSTINGFQRCIEVEQAGPEVNFYCTYKGIDGFFVKYKFIMIPNDIENMDVVAYIIDELSYRYMVILNGKSVEKIEEEEEDCYGDDEYEY